MSPVAISWRLFFYIMVVRIIIIIISISIIFIAPFKNRFIKWSMSIKEKNHKRKYIKIKKKLKIHHE